MNSHINIKTMSHLAMQLDVHEDWLVSVANSIRRYVLPGPKHRKSDGSYRQTQAPSDDLKEIQKRINKRLLQKIPLPSEFHGGVPGKSTVTNALPHVGKPVVASLDIKDFYPSIRYDHVYSLFIDLGCAPDVARLLTRLTTYNYQLAQGFPTSPAIANLIFARIWPRIGNLCKHTKVTPTIFLDDLSLSGGRRVWATQKLSA